MKNKILLTIILGFCIFKLQSQIIPVSLGYKIKIPPFIIEGQVLEIISKQDKLKTTIFTDCKLKIVAEKRITNKKLLKL